MRHDSNFYKSAIEKMFYIVNRDMKAIPFKLKPAQDRINKDLSGMDIILKARQQGISAYVSARFLVDWLTVENIRCVIISHENEATQRLFDRIRYFLESMNKTWPGELPYKLKYNSRREIVNTVKNSVFYIGTAGARAFGRGDTINNLHISEISLWPEQERMMVGLMQAVPKDGNVIIESTANGMGDYFYDLCMKAQAKKNPFSLHFIPWFEDPEYVMPVTYPMEFTPEEQMFINKYGLKREQLAWRRWKINQMNGDWQDPTTWDKFNQEFPDTIENAFIVSGNPVFSPTLLKRYLVHCTEPTLVGNLIGYSPVTVEPNEKGYLKVWKRPNEYHTYAIGVDVSEGKTVGVDDKKERDASCAQVFDKNTYEQVAVLHGQFDPDRLGRMLELLGRYYNDALIGVESNAVGLTPLTVLRDLSYPNLYYREKFGLVTEKLTAEMGWRTDLHTKELLISEAITLLRDSRVQLYDRLTIGEMIAFVRDADGAAHASKGAHDDRVMSFLIALQMLKRARASSSTNEIERDDITAGGGFFMGGQSFDKNGMPVAPSEMHGGDELYDGSEF